MGQSEKKLENQTATSPSVEEGGEIDRIMKEIEDLEKQMDSAVEEEAASAESTKVVPLRPEASERIEEAKTSGVAKESTDLFGSNTMDSSSDESSSESLVETDARPADNSPLVQNLDPMSDGSNGLALKVGGCTQISLEFSRSNITVSLSCDDESLCITTDQGAEFRIPFKK